MKEQIKGIVFDIDDTLFSHKTNEVPPMTMTAIKELKENGYKLGICTSRYPAEFVSLPKELLDQFDLISCGTGSILIEKGQVVKMKLLDPTTAQEITTYLDEEQIPYLWVTEAQEEHYSVSPGEKAIEHAKSWKGFVPTVQKWNHEPLITIMFSQANEVQRNHICSFKDKMAVQLWGNGGQINAPDVNKAFGLKLLAEKMGLSIKELAVFGDGSNDISMIDAAGIGIAVYDSNEELQRHAAMITSPIETGGIYTTCKKMGWIPEDEMIRLLFFDIDGTTYQHNIQDNPTTTKIAFKKLKEKGYKLAICTSRAYEEMRALPKDFVEQMDAIITCAGGRILIDGENVYQYLDQAEVQKGIAYLDDHNLPYRWVDDREGCHLNKSYPDIDERFRYLYAMVPTPQAYKDERLIHLLYYTHDEQDVQELMNIFKKGSHIHFGFGNEITALGVDKGSAMEIVARHYGMTLENVAAFGDGHNDVCMMEKAKIGVAMGNACDPCKEAANYVTDPIDEDGLYNACVQFGWIEP